MADLSKILENAPGECWLALNEDESKIVGRGEDIREAIEEAKENGVDVSEDMTPNAIVEALRARNAAA